MSRPLRFALLVALAFVVVSLLPVFPEQTLMRSYTVNGTESVQRVWTGASLYAVWGVSGLWRVGYLILAGLYALLVAAGALRLWDRIDAR